MAVGECKDMYFHLKTDAPFSSTRGLINIKPDTALFLVSQNSLQLYALSMASSFEKGVCLLATDCNQRWEIYSFSSTGSTILRKAYQSGKLAFETYMQLIETAHERQSLITSSFNKNKKQKRKDHSMMRSELHDNEQDLEGFSFSPADITKAKAMEQEAMLERFADFLGDRYETRPVIPSWARAEARCPNYYS